MCLASLYYWDNKTEKIYPNTIKVFLSIYTKLIIAFQPLKTKANVRDSFTIDENRITL